MSRTVEMHDEEYKKMVEMEKEMVNVKDQAQQKMLFLKRLLRENDVTAKQTLNKGEGTKVRDALSRAEREVQILEGKLESKRRFMGVLANKKTENDKGEENRQKNKDYQEKKKVK